MRIDHLLFIDCATDDGLVTECIYLAGDAAGTFVDFHLRGVRKQFLLSVGDGEAMIDVGASLLEVHRGELVGEANPGAK